MHPAEQLKTLLDSGLLSKHNAERIARVFYDAAKIVYERQKQLDKKQLKMKEVSSALVLAETIHSQAFHFDATGALAQLFGDCPEGVALDYYEKHVIGEVVDMYKRKIVIDEDGMKSLYKEAKSGRHVVASENYEEGRGKRLPWIRHALQHSSTVLAVEETVQGSFRRSFLYTAVVSIPIQPKPQTSYYVVVVREGKNGELRLVTAYSMFKRNRFLSVIALSKHMQISQ